MLTEDHDVFVVNCFHDFYDRTPKEANLAKARTSQRLHFFELNVRETEQLQAIWASERFEIVVHLAAWLAGRPHLIAAVESALGRNPTLNFQPWQPGDRVERGSRAEEPSELLRTHGRHAFPDSPADASRAASSVRTKVSAS